MICDKKQYLVKIKYGDETPAVPADTSAVPIAGNASVEDTDISDSDTCSTEPKQMTVMDWMEEDY